VREKRWVFAPRDAGAASRLASSLRISGLTAQILVNRGIRDIAEATLFLRPQLKGLIDPSVFREMPKAVARLEAALRNNEPIAIFGDYDVDGTTGTAILAKFFRLLGKSVTTRVPHRVKDGYGLNAAVVAELAALGAKVLITIDCGTNNHKEIALAKSMGMDTIVIDHHEAPKAASIAEALINPKAEDGYPFKGICSAGIAFKLAWALSTGISQSSKLSESYRAFLLDALGYVALGTVADVSPLVGENRVFVSYGLDALRACKGLGIRGLIEKAGCGEKGVDAWDIGFRLAPRLNAVGRMATASSTIDLLTSEDPAAVKDILALLESSNRARKDVEDGIVSDAKVRMKKEVDLERDRVIVLADEKWHVGVVGIVASRIVDEHARPAFVLAVTDGIAKGSARSVEGFALHEAIEASRDLILTGGGHAMAAGVTLKVENLPAFRERLNTFAEKHLEGRTLEPTLEIDDEVSLDRITMPVVEELKRLEPHGEGNPPPMLASRKVRVCGEPRLMGRKNEHMSCLVRQGEGPALRAVGFRMAEYADRLRGAQNVSIAYTPNVNEWNGYRNVELMLEDVKFE
jgi:single-stranded-DNA-specific exonuclease